MTVYEMLLYTAQMKLPHKEPKAAKKEAVENIMERLGLTAARDTLIGGKSVKGISGGQVNVLTHEPSELLELTACMSATWARLGRACAFREVRASWQGSTSDVGGERLRSL